MRRQFIRSWQHLPGRHYQCRARPHRADHPGQVQAVQAAGHLDVGKHRRYAVFLQQLKRLVNVTGFLYRLAVFFEDFSDRSSDDGFVVNDEDNFAHCCE